MSADDSAEITTRRSGYSEVEDVNIVSSGINYVVHGIAADQLEVLSQTIDAIQDMFSPTNVTKIRFFLALWNGFQRLVPNFARIVVPITKELHKGKQRRLKSLKNDV